MSQPPVIQATFKDAKGQTTTFETDAIGRVTKQIDALNRTTLIDRDQQGNPLTITRPNGAVTTMTYDARAICSPPRNRVLRPRPASSMSRHLTK